MAVVDFLTDLVAPGSLVALGDGTGSPVELLPAVAAGHDPGALRLLVGWSTRELGEVPAAFGDVATLMAGYGARPLLESGRARYLPTRLGASPALLQQLRPDVLLASVVATAHGYLFTTEVSWHRAAVAAGAHVLAVETRHPCGDAGPPLPGESVTVLRRSEAPPEPFRWSRPSEVHAAIAAHVAALVPDGARLQFAPGALGVAVVRALSTRVHVDTGVLTEAVVELDRRGLLLGRPLAPYAVGSAELLDWLDGRQCLRGIEHTHNAARLLDGPPLVAVNTALEVDVDGQINVESTRGVPIAGIGGQPDFMAAASSMPGGLSILAVPTHHGQRSTLVEQLSSPVSTPSHDVDVVVTEHGTADLRGLDREGRRRAIRRLWAG